MKLLLDTHIVLWWLDDPNLVAEDSADLIFDPTNEVLVSAVCAREIAIKRALGKVTAPHNLQAVIRSAGFAELSITHTHALAIESLPDHHRDPFDRLLIAQAIIEGCKLVTRDESIKRYAVDIVDG